MNGQAITFRNQSIEIGRKQAALLVYLALDTQGKISRDRIIGMLWSELSAERARRNLRQLWKKLRDLLHSRGYDGLEGSNSRYLSIDLDKVDIDINQVLQPQAIMNPPVFLLEQHRIHETFLIDFEGIDNEYDNWILLQRHALLERLTHQLENALDQCSEKESRQVATALHNLDPSNEIAARRLMRLHAHQSNISGALKVYKELTTLLDNEYGMDPTNETELLAVEIKQIDASGFLDKTAEGRSQDTSSNTESPMLVIDEFNTELVPDNQIYIAQGFRHDLMASLARLRDWRVIEKTPSIVSIKKLKNQVSRHELRAQVYIDNADLQLVFTVVEASSFTVIWSDKYVLRMESWLSTQTAIIRRLAVALNVNLSADRLNAIWRNRELPAALHDRWLLGQSYIYRWTPESSAKASEIFQTINTEAPDFAPAFSGRVQIENSRHLVFPGLRRKALDDQSTLRLARRAVQIDPLDSKAHLCMAWSLCLSGRFEEALRYFDSANEINENDPWTIISTAQGYAFCDEIDRATVLVETANELNLSLNQLHSAYHVGTKYLCGDYKGAIESAEIAGDIISNIRAWKTAALWHMGHKDDARAEGQEFLALHREYWYGKNKIPADEEISDWILHCFPFRSVKNWEHFRDGLKCAGVAVPNFVQPPHG